MKGDEYAEEVAFLRSLGTSDAQIATQLRVTPGAVAKAFYRSGRPEMARQFEALARGGRVRRDRDRKKPCPSCGRPCKHTSRTCMACFRSNQRGVRA